MLKRLWSRLNRWYVGKPIVQPKVVLYLHEQYQRHWTARAVHTMVVFYFKHWQWLLVFIVGIIGLLLM